MLKRFYKRFQITIYCKVICLRSRWREYLNGEYQTKDKDKMNWEIRRRAKQMMRDLLLITRKTPQRQRDAIFKTPETRDKLVIPLVRELFNSASFMSPGQKEYEATAKLARSLESAGIPYNWVKLLEDKVYRDQKKVQLGWQTF